MRHFTTIKTGYTAGVYGNTGEYFTTILINGKNTSSLRWHGQYGAEYRIAEFLKARGYKEFYTPANYGRLKRDDIMHKVTYSEYELLNGGKLWELVRAMRNSKANKGGN